MIQPILPYIENKNTDKEITHPTRTELYIKINELIQEINRIKKLIEPTHH